MTQQSGELLPQTTDEQTKTNPTDEIINWDALRPGQFGHLPGVFVQKHFNIRDHTSGAIPTPSPTISDDIEFVD